MQYSLCGRAEAHSGGRGLPLSQAEVGLVGDDRGRRGLQEPEEALARRLLDAQALPRSPAVANTTKAKVTAKKLRERHAVKAKAAKTPASGRHHGHAGHGARPRCVVGASARHPRAGHPDPADDRPCSSGTGPQGGACVLPLGRRWKLRLRHVGSASAAGRGNGRRLARDGAEQRPQHVPGGRLALASVLPATSYEQGMDMANRIHTSGQAIVWSRTQGSRRAVLGTSSQGHGLTMAPLEKG